MEVAIVYKWAYDPDDAYITSDGSFRWKRGQLVANDDDAAAIASARILAESTGGSLTGVTIGNGDASWAAARGAQKVVCAPEVMPCSDDAALASDIFSAVNAVGSFDVVVIADAINTAGVAPLLAEKLGVPCVTGVRSFEAASEQGRIIAHRESGGLYETIGFSTPVVIAVSAEKSGQDVPGMKQMLAARKIPGDKIEIEAANRNALVVDSLGKAESKMARLFEGTAAQAAVQLVSKLREDGIL